MLRAVAIMFSLRERSSGTSARPRPEDVPVMSQVRGGNFRVSVVDLGKRGL